MIESEVWSKAQPNAIAMVTMGGLADLFERGWISGRGLALLPPLDPFDHLIST